MEEKMDISRASYASKEEFSLPEGAKVLKKDYNIRVQEIENGYIIEKSYNIEYMSGDNKEYGYHCKKWYSKTNPLELKLNKEAKYLADEF